jgi:hypothetical protein
VKITESPAVVSSIVDLESKIRVLRTALEEIIRLNQQYSLDKYGDSTRVESYACVKTARNALEATKD